MQRPTGVTVIAVLAFIEAGFLVVISIVPVVLIISNNAKPGAFVAVLLRVVLVLALAALQAAVGYGILRLKNWARLTTMVIQALSVLVYLTQILTVNNPSDAPSQPDPQTRVFFALFWLALSGWVLYYITRPHVKQAFGTTGL